LAYEVIWHEGALKDLKNLERNIAKSIIQKVKNYLVQDPIKLGKRLTGDFAGLHRYRFGDYRIIYTIDQGEEKIKVLFAGHRKEVYKKLGYLTPRKK